MTHFTVGQDKALRVGALGDRGFDHGLIVGYAVATKVFQRKLSER